jgi:hypothetical protein
MPPPAAPAPQEARQGEHHRAHPPNDDEQMGEINMIFRGSISSTLKTQWKKLEREISLAQCIEPRRRMRWSDVDISFGSQDHPDTKLYDRNLPFMIKLPIGQHKVAKTFHGIIPWQSSTPVRRIDLELSCGSGDNKRKDLLMFEVANFDIGYNCILGRTFHLKFMAVIHTAYATLKMPGPKGMNTIKADQCDALACENTTLTHGG